MKKKCNSDGRHYWYGNGKTVKDCIKKNEHIKQIRQKIAQEKLNRINIDLNKE
jgi:hypothetical protein